MENTITDQIKTLLEMQGLDLQINSIEERLKEIPLKIQEKWKKVREKEEEVSRIKKEIEKTILQRKEKELELETNQQTIKKYQVQLYQVKTNKEYASLLHEIEDLKRKNSLLEDEIIELMEKTESGEEVLQREKEELEKLKEKVKNEEEEGKKEMEKLKKEEDELMEKKNALAKEVRGDLLNRYEKLIKSRGTALAKVINGVCGGCHLQLPPQVVSEVRSGRKVVTCERCSRILYWESNISSDTSLNQR